MVAFSALNGTSISHVELGSIHCSSIYGNYSCVQVSSLPNTACSSAYQHLLEPRLMQTKQIYCKTQSQQTLILKVEPQVQPKVAILCPLTSLSHAWLSKAIESNTLVWVADELSLGLYAGIFYQSQNVTQIQKSKQSILRCSGEEGEGVGCSWLQSDRK